MLRKLRSEIRLSSVPFSLLILLILWISNPFGSGSPGFIVLGIVFTIAAVSITFERTNELILFLGVNFITLLYGIHLWFGHQSSGFPIALVLALGAGGTGIGLYAILTNNKSVIPTTIRDRLRQ